MLRHLSHAVVNLISCERCIRRAFALDVFKVGEAVVVDGKERLRNFVLVVGIYLWVAEPASERNCVHGRDLESLVRACDCMVRYSAAHLRAKDRLRLFRVPQIVGRARASCHTIERQRRGLIWRALKMSKIPHSDAISAGISEISQSMSLFHEKHIRCMRMYMYVLCVFVCLCVLSMCHCDLLFL